MVTLHERYVVDAQGKRLQVILDVEEYEKLLEELEELEAIEGFKAAEASGEQPVPFEDVVKQIEANRG